MKTIIASIVGFLTLLIVAFRKGKSTAKTEEKLNRDEELIKTLKTQQDNAEYVRNLTDKQLNDELHIFTKKRD